VFRRLLTAASSMAISVDVAAGDVRTVLMSVLVGSALPSQNMPPGQGRQIDVSICLYKG